MNDPSALCRVVYAGTDRQPRSRVFGRIGLYESERAWRQRLAQEMEDACQEMARRGLYLVAVVPTLSSTTWQGSWTEGAWLYFASAKAHPSPAVRGRPE